MAYTLSCVIRLYNYGVDLLIKYSESGWPVRLTASNHNDLYMHNWALFSILEGSLIYSLLISNYQACAMTRSKQIRALPTAYAETVSLFPWSYQ